jgi:hypothetical protein
MSGPYQREFPPPQSQPPPWKKIITGNLEAVLFNCGTFFKTNERVFADSEK